MKTRLADCMTIEDVVEYINDSENPESVAAQYAIDAIKESGYSIDEYSIDAHLDVIERNGAEFDTIAAAKIALKNQA